MKVCVFLSDSPDCFSYGYDEAHPRCIKLKLTLLRYIELLHLHGYHYFVTDCEFGAGFWAAEIVADLLPLHKDMWFGCIIPYEEQAVKWSVEQRERYFSLQEKSAEVRFLQKKYTTHCVENCQQYLINHADALLIVRSLQNPKNVKFINSQKKNIPIICINPETGMTAQYLAI